jgi:hypothetical protein
MRKYDILLYDNTRAWFYQKRSGEHKKSESELHGKMRIALV